MRLKNYLNEEEQEIVISAPMNDKKAQSQVKKVLSDMDINYSENEMKNEMLFMVKCKDTDKLQKLRNTEWKKGIELR